MNFKIEFSLPSESSEFEAATQLRKLAERIDSIDFNESNRLSIYSELGSKIGKAEWTE